MICCINLLQRIEEYLKHFLIVSITTTKFFSTYELKQQVLEEKFLYLPYQQI